MRCFSLFHEVCHLAIGRPGVSGGETLFLRRPAGRKETVEFLCDRFSAAFLLPLGDEQVRHSLESMLDRHSGVDKAHAIEVARKFKVSKYVVLFRAREAGLLSWHLCMQIFSDWQEEDTRQVDGGPKKETGGPISSVLKGNQRGKRFVSLVFEALDSGRISVHEASNYLSLNVADLGDARESGRQGSAMTNSHDIVYCIDASAFIDIVQAARDIPDLWEPITDLAQNGHLIMPEQVKAECKDPEGQPWLDRHNRIVRVFTEDLNDAINQLQADLDADGQWLVNPGSIKDLSDPWVVALAMSENKLLGGSYGSGRVMVVCHEKPNGAKKGKIKIPDACDRYRIPCVRLRKLLELEGWRLRKV